MFLAGDIGGTKTILALFPLAEPGAHLAQPGHSHIYPSDGYNSLEAVVVDFIARTGVQPVAASFGVAGPVIDGRAQVTNLPWVIDTAVLQQTLGTPNVYLLNDLESIANAVPYLTSDELITVNEGQRHPTGPIAVIAPGTGLGEAFLIHDGQQYRAFPSEGGHATFSPVNAVQRELLAYLESRFDHVSFERVCSGSGIPNLYAFLRDSGRFAEPPHLKEQLATTENWTPVIVNAAQAGEADICIATLDLFIDILANETSNNAIRLLATGGIYLGGGIPPRIVPQLTDGDFMHRYSLKGRFSEMVSRMPVHIIKDPLAGLHGAAYFGLEMVRREIGD
ncbi:MAG: glucokinase [Anaerolineae bacterium]|nr:glucokinase [Anaerolineae bacterium]